MSAGGGGRQQLQQLSEELQAIDEELDELRTEVQNLKDKKTEMDDAIEALEVLETGSTVQVPLGGGAYVRAEIDDIDEVVVSLGGGYAAEQDQDGATETLEHNQEAIDGRIADLEEEISDLEEESSEIEEQAQQLQGQLQQQQMQQMQQQMDQQGDE